MTRTTLRVMGVLESLLKPHTAPDTRALEADIDRLVYALYGVTAEDIAVVEGQA